MKLQNKTAIITGATSGIGVWVIAVRIAARDDGARQPPGRPAKNDHPLQIAAATKRAFAYNVCPPCPRRLVHDSQAHRSHRSNAPRRRGVDPHHDCHGRDGAYRCQREGRRRRSDQPDPLEDARLIGLPDRTA